MPEVVMAALARVQRRWRMRSVLHALAIGGALFGAVLLVTHSTATAMAMGAIAAVAVYVAARPLSVVDAARAVEAKVVPLDNLIVTAAELDRNPRPVRAEVLDAIKSQAAERIRGVDVRDAVALGQPAVIAASVVVGCLALVFSPRTAFLAQTEIGGTTAQHAESFSMLVRVSPPAYTARKVELFENPTQITAIAGSTVRVETKGTGRVLREFVATESMGLEIGPDASTKKFLSILVLPDEAPAVRIVTPGRDTALAKPAGAVPINIEGRDDLGLTQLTLRLTKASGGGENVAFTDSDVPVRVERRSDREWIGRATIALEGLALEDGDVVVYRAIARDTNPRGAPVQSEQYVIEIGKNAEIADAGFALPPEERKYAISQQMVIYKTEQAIARKLAGTARLDESRAIAIEQRMVRAEIVFLGGGEVEDELEEAAKSDELTEGRLQNTGRVEMLRAINAMSRAEAQLNEGRLPDALVFERQALASLERALDRRRYFLRTLPNRSRIDSTRRLTGERRDARSWVRNPTIEESATVVEAHRTLMRDLSAVTAQNAPNLAARLTAIDASSQDLRRTAVALANATTDADRQVASRAAMEALTAHALKILPNAARVVVPSAALSGRLADELKKGSGAASRERKP